MKHLIFATLMTLTTATAQAEWTDLYTTPTAEIQAHRIGASERTTNFRECDYRLKLPRNSVSQADRYFYPLEESNAVHFVDEMKFNVGGKLGKHAVDSQGSFAGTAPTFASIDQRDEYSVRIILGRASTTKKILNVVLKHLSINSPYATERFLSALPAYEPKLVIQRRCAVETELEVE